MLDRVQIKREAKGITRNACVSAYVMTLLYLAITHAMGTMDFYISGDYAAYMEMYAPSIPIPDFLYGPAGIPAMVVLFISVMVALVGSVLRGGLVLYHLGVRRGEQMPYTTLFDGFSFVGKLILLEIVMYIFVTLWSMLFVIPGIIATYRYRFALYNLCENPEMGIMDAIHMSKMQTYGYKMDLFVLDLSFFGWSFLCVLTMGILSIWIHPYIQQTDIGYFQQIKTAKGIGWFPPQDPLDDGQFHPQDPFDPRN